MRRLLLIAAVAAIAVAKPELYREKEDFQYSRSSSDDGTKSGFYGAQRGNMGGNFERAHNMDPLAQHQMSGLVSQVEGELRDGVKSKTGSVYSAANSRGVYGSGHYDLSNLEGRNFQEGVSLDDTQASSLSHDSGFATHSSSHNSQYSHGLTQSSRYTGSSGKTEQSSQARNLQSIDNQKDAGQYEYGNQQSSGYYSQSGYERQNQYENTNINQHRTYGSNAQTRLISATPVKLVIRPGTRVSIPVAAQTYDAHNAESQHIAAISSNRNSLHTEAEVLNNDNQQIYYVPSSKPKHYESSYKYHKEWEKHDTQPVPLAIPTANTFAKTNELYDHTQIGHQTGSRYQDSRLRTNSDHSLNSYKEYNARTASTSQRHNSDYADLQSSGSGSNSNLYTHNNYDSDMSANKNSISIDDSKPKSYHSSYAYHKSWERQGDPYVIKPATNGVYDEQRLEKLTASNQAAYSSSHQYGSRSHQTHQSYLNGGNVDCDCDENGHIRVPRSYNQDEVQQQAQSKWENFEQQNQWDELGQQTQNLWDQQSQSGLSNLEDLGQQTQNEWNQQTQSGLAKLEDLRQQSQNKWDQLEDLGQQTQNNWDQQSQQGHEKLKDLGQQTQNLGIWDKFDGPGQQRQNIPDIWDKVETSEKMTPEKVENLDQNKQKHPKIEGQGQSNVNMNSYNQGERLNTHENKENLHKLHSFNSNTPPPKPIINKDKPQETFYNGANEQQELENTDQNQQILHQVHQNINLDQQNPNFWVNYDTLSLNSQQSIKPVWEQNQDNIQTDKTLNIRPDNFYFNTNNNMPWTFHEKHHDYDFFGQQSQTNVEKYNWNTNEHTGFHNHHNWDETFPSNDPHNHPHGTSSIQSLWDKINNIESFSNSMTNNRNDFNLTENENHSSHSENSNTSQGNLSTHKPAITTEKPLKSLNPIESLPAEDIERGDIGPENSVSHLVTSSTEKNFKNEHNTYVFTTVFSNKPYKTPAEIEVLSLKNENNAENTTEQNTNQENALNVLSLKEQDEIGQKHNIYTTSTTTPKINTIFQENIGLGQQNNMNQQDTQTYINNIQKQNTFTQLQQNIKPQVDNSQIQNQFEESQHNIDQQTVDLGQQHEINQQYQPWETEIEQQNMDQQLVDFGQESENLNQQNKALVLETDQQNMGQELVDFGQQSENLNQHNEQMFLEAGQHNMGQQLVDFGQQNLNLQIVPLETQQQNIDQQLVDLSQQNDNMHQQTQKQWEQSQDMQQNENAWQPNENVQQHAQELGSFQSNDPKQQVYDEKLHPDTYNEQNMPKVKDQEKIPEKITEMTSPESTITEKPGFWRSVGKKFTNAKDKVASWFKSN